MSRKSPSQRDSAYVQQRMARTLQSMVPGTMGGRFFNAAPISATAGDEIGGLEASTPAEVIFSQSGFIQVLTSQPWTPRTTTTVEEVAVLLGTAGTSSSIVNVRINGTVVHTTTMTSGTKILVEPIDLDLTANTDILTVELQTIGTGAQDLTVIVRLA